mmetsp:Transcript_151512/g.385167  ORF Transcript_151512/g.385167 Transcript_151512/m.385167 type:complete len:95 (+) Transcript_151512:1598-1882(+)
MEAMDINEESMVLPVQGYRVRARNYATLTLRLLVRISRLGFSMVSAKENLVLPAPAPCMQSRFDYHDIPDVANTVRLLFVLTGRLVAQAQLLVL